MGSAVLCGVFTHGDVSIRLYSLFLSSSFFLVVTVVCGVVFPAQVGVYEKKNGKIGYSFFVVFCLLVFAWFISIGKEFLFFLRICVYATGWGDSCGRDGSCALLPSLL